MLISSCDTTSTATVISDSKVTGPGSGKEIKTQLPQPTLSPQRAPSLWLLLLEG